MLSTDVMTVLAVRVVGLERGIQEEIQEQRAFETRKVRVWFWGLSSYILCDLGKIP